MEGTAHTYIYGLVEIVVHRPTLSDQERKKQEAALERAVATYGKETMKKAVKA